MIDNSANSKLNLPMQTEDNGYSSTSRENRALDDVLGHRNQHPDTSEMNNQISTNKSAIRFDEILYAIEEMLSYQQRPEQLISDLTKIYAKLFKADGVCIFESNIKGEIKPVAYNSYRLNGLSSIKSLFNPAVSSSFSSVVKALDKDQSIKILEVSLGEGKTRHSVSLPLMYDSSIMRVISLFSTDLQYFSPEYINVFRLVTHFASLFFKGERQGKFISNNQSERIILQDKIFHLQNEIGTRQTTSPGNHEDICKELEALSYSISHDLRAPLRAIYNNSEWLNNHCSNELDVEKRRILEQIISSSKYMENLLDGLLEFSKSVQSELEYHPIDMTSLANSVSKELLMTDKDPSTISISIQPLINAYGDRILMRQVWYNLLSNAFKFTGQKQKREIEINCYESGKEVTYYVKDNGAGFDMQYADQLFKAFHRLHEVEDFEGTGVGLAIVNRIIKRHGGRTWANGKTNDGAQFYFTLPNRRIEQIKQTGPDYDTTTS